MTEAGSNAPAASGPNETDREAPLRYRDVPHTMMRRTIARRLVESKQQVPHYYLKVNCSIDALLALRARLNQEKPDHKVSINDLVVRAAALALRATPEANVSFEEKSLRFHDTVDVAVAVATPRGLVTPIVRDADIKSPRALATEIADLASRAKAGKLKPEEYQGGSISISNLGMFGIEEFSAIINPPQSCIFAVGAGIRRPVEQDGSLAFATIMSTTISVDHRSVDGAIAARLVRAYKELVEAPERLVD